VDAERIENMFEALLYGSKITDPVAILREINDKLIEEQRGNI